MKKRLFVLFLVLCLSAGLSVTALAATGDDYVVDHTIQETVELTAANKIKSSFADGTTANPSTQLDYLEPEDGILYQVTLTNKSSEAVDWYMTNSVIRSLEDSDALRRSIAHDGAYVYELVYNMGKSDEKILYSSRNVGGEYSRDGKVGLHEAATALKKYTYLTTMNPGGSGVLTLYLQLEGDSQANSYQSTLGLLNMKFAVELKNNDVVKTGDETNLLPWYIAMTVSGLVFLGLAFSGLRERKEEKRRAA